MGALFRICIVSLAAAALQARAADAAYAHLERAYAALRAKDYDAAIAAFRRALDAGAGRPAVYKDLAYTYLKVGENEAARDQFERAMKLDPADHHVALEYAFLCYETGREAEARRVFDRVRKEGDAESRRTAEEAYQRIDSALAAGIARWQEVVAADPANFSAHRELARLADRRDDKALALEHYRAAWRLRPDERELLLDIARLARELGRENEAMAALLAASRGGEPRTADRARELLPDRYPYAYEFEAALALDPANVKLRREYAYLLLEMGSAAEAERQFARLVADAPDDLLSTAQLGFLLLDRGEHEQAMPLLKRVLDGGDPELAERVRKTLNLPRASRPARPSGASPPPASDAKAMGRKSLELGYLKDALKYLQLAHEADPLDFEVMLDLGRAWNILKRDDEAIRWFDLARRSPDPEIAAEARRAYRNLRPAHKRLRHTFWVLPFYSSRWKDAFGYAQFKTEIRLKRLPLRPYVSVRFAGDARRTIGSVLPQYLSESSFVAGVGIRTVNWNGLMGWAEAGSDISYLDRRDRPGRMAPDYRGGVSFSKAWGSLLGGEAPGWFFETYENGLYMSRFDHTLLAYFQNRAGYTFPALGSFQFQAGWNGNLTVEAKRQPWANFAEHGPALRFRWSWMPKPMVISVDLLRGVYLLRGSPFGPRYTDLRVGVWYAVTW